jgi:uncharacterized protein
MTSDIWTTALSSAESYARARLTGRSCGHDFFHTDRVRRNALRLQSVEGGDPRVIELAALLHDVADPKLVEDADQAQRELEVFLRGLSGISSAGVSSADVDHVLTILAGMSFGKELSGVIVEKTTEFKIVQDADRLEAIGAIGIARCFAYGGSVNQALYDPEIPERTTLDAKAYRAEKSSSLNHFAEKLFLLKDRMNTETAKRWAEDRHAFTVEFRTRFLAEAGAENPAI